MVLTFTMIEQALAQTDRARDYILDEVMLKAIAEPRKELSPYAPKIATDDILMWTKLLRLSAQEERLSRRLWRNPAVQIDTEDDGTIYIKGIDHSKASRWLRI